MPVLCRCLLLCAIVGVLSAATPRSPEAAATPAPLGDKAQPRHEQLLAKAKLGGYGLVMIGDSITDWWPGRGKATWKLLEAYKPLNLGWAGQHTEHILWRFAHGEIDGLDPKLVTIMIGTNNLGHIGSEKPEWVADGVGAIVAMVRGKLPRARILLFGIFPRGGAQDPIRTRIAAANALIAKLADGKTVVYQDIGAQFLDADGSIPKEMMGDALHPGDKGYRIWFDAMKPTLDEVFGAR